MLNRPNTLINRLLILLRPALFPFSICLFLCVYILAYNILNFPSPHDLTSLIIEWFNKYGLRLLFLSAFLEGIFVIGMYFPGSLAIALAVYVLGKTPLDLFYIGGISFIAFLLANVCNYYLGKYGYYKFMLLIGQKDAIKSMHKTMEQKGNRIFFLTGFFPNFIAITSVCAGISNLNIYKTVLYLTLSLLFWVTIWTIAGSFLITRINLENNNQSIYLLGVIFLWGIYLIIKNYYKMSK
jgi:membrane protein DedA with SNARE-associated domain